MIYKVHSCLSDLDIVELVEIDRDMCKVKDIRTGETEWLYLSWIREYIKNKGEIADEI